MLPSILRKRPVFFNDLFDGFLPAYTSENSYNSVAVNVEENDNEYRIEVAAPGLEKADFKVTVNEGVLTVSSEKKSEKEDKNGNYIRHEFGYNSFSRSFSLPEETDAEKISAKHKNGVLSVTIPKAEVKVNPSKDIKIS